jgi:pimeloyl-ACP methyl ester carboxylesterase
MNLMFFGRAHRQLLGAYHEPQPATPVRGAAVLCAPWGAEYFVSHRILRHLALRLSEAGYHVLRFDYYGTGDSAGGREEGDLASWYDDACLAVDEVKAMSEEATVLALGVRLGAVIAWRLALTRKDVRAVVLWDPIVTGRDYLAELALMQAEVDRWSLSPPPTPISRDAPDHLMGMPLSPSMRNSIEAVTPAEYRQHNPARVSVFFSEDGVARLQLQESLQSGGTPVHVETMPGETAWRTADPIGVVPVPNRLLERIVEVVG